MYDSVSKMLARNAWEGEGEMKPIDYGETWLSV